MMTALCDQCRILFDAEKTFCRICGDTLQRHPALEATARCPSCRLDFYGFPRQCPMCSGALVGAGHVLPLVT
ncbi:MAG TPA: hypothetical protein VN648_20750, partial [Candidatus Methylomirabilis sp.]|nr:hypothetical protein [Candidatus Methylomirabilis sp.]